MRPFCRPNYVTGHWSNLGSLVLSLNLSTALMLYATWENGKRANGDGDGDHRLSEGDVGTLGFRHPTIRYTIWMAIRRRGVVPYRYLDTQVGDFMTLRVRSAVEAGADRNTSHPPIRPHTTTGRGQPHRFYSACADRGSSPFSSNQVCKFWF